MTAASTSAPSWRRRALAVLVAGLLVAAVPLSSSPARGQDAEPDAQRDLVVRVAGEGRVQTAVALSQRAFSGGASRAVLARADAFADALSATALAAEVGGPVLLTGSERLDDSTRQELRRLEVDSVYLVGGDQALSPRVEADVAAAGLATARLAGDTRFATAGAVAGEVVALGGPVDQVIVARADQFADALTAGNVAAAGRAPILLTAADEVPDATLEALAEVLSGDQVLVAGGPAAVGDRAASQLTASGYRVTRLAGADRYATAVALVDEAVRQGAAREPMLLASAADFPDALAAVAAAHALGGTLLLVHPETVAGSPVIRDYVRQHAEEIDTALVVGGPNAVGEAVADEVQRLLADAPREAGDDGGREDSGSGGGGDADSDAGEDADDEGQTGDDNDQGDGDGGDDGQQGDADEGEGDGEQPDGDGEGDNGDDGDDGDDGEGDGDEGEDDGERPDDEEPDDGEQPPMPEDDGPPAPVTDFTATPGDGRVRLTWTPSPSPGVDTYYLQITTVASDAYGCESPQYYGLTFTTEGGREADSYLHDDATNGVTYCYRLRARDTQSGSNGVESEPRFAGPVTPRAEEEAQTSPKAGPPAMVEAEGFQAISIDATGPLVGDDLVRVRYDEPLQCSDIAPEQFRYADGTGTAAPTAVECEPDRPDEVTLRLPPSTLEGSELGPMSGTLTYAESADASRRVLDASGDPGVSPDEVDVSCCTTIAPDTT